VTDFETRIRELAAQHPTRPLEWAIAVVDYADSGKSMPPPDPRGPVEVHAEFAMQQPLVMKFLHEDKKINAIKELRAAGNMGLKEAKDAVELVALWEAKGYVPEHERQLIEREALEAVESIRRTMAAMRAGAANAGVKFRGQRIEKIILDEA
jgi:ribosomal protein L7/L12